MVPGPETDRLCTVFTTDCPLTPAIRNKNPTIKNLLFNSLLYFMPVYFNPVVITVSNVYLTIYVSSDSHGHLQL